MKKAIKIRLARAEDKEAVVAFTQNTFSWGDYVSNVFLDWVRDPHGRLLVATVNRQPIALVHAAFLENGVAWMEGMRVNPHFRQQGVASTLETAARASARDNGCQIARLATSIKNIAAQGTLSKLGYHRAAQFNEWETSSTPTQSKLSASIVATRAQLPHLLSVWRESPIREAGHSVIPNRRWRWTALDSQRLSEEINSNQVRLLRDGFALLLAFDENDYNALSLHALAGDERTMHELVLEAQNEAAYRGYAGIEAILPDHASLNAALERAAFRRSGGMYIYEQEL